MITVLLLILKVLCTFLVFFSTLPLVMSFIQFAVIGFHRFFTGYDKLVEYFPKVAIIVPAWNEAPVLSNTVDQLMNMEYPRDSLRIYVVDDASVRCIRAPDRARPAPTLAQPNLREHQ